MTLLLIKKLHIFLPKSLFIVFIFLNTNIYEIIIFFIKIFIMCRDWKDADDGTLMLVSCLMKSKIKYCLFLLKCIQILFPFKIKNNVIEVLE